MFEEAELDSHTRKKLLGSGDLARSVSPYRALCLYWWLGNSNAHRFLETCHITNWLTLRTSCKLIFFGGGADHLMKATPFGMEWEGANNAISIF